MATAPMLMDYQTGKILRDATKAEIRAFIAQGGVGAIDVGGRSCCVQDVETGRKSITIGGVTAQPLGNAEDWYICPKCGGACCLGFPIQGANLSCAECGIVAQELPRSFEGSDRDDET